VLAGWQLAVQFSGAGSRVPYVADRVATAFVMWTLLLAVIGLFIRFVRHENRGMRYLSDASYWMYIVHLPVVIWTAGLLARVPAFAFVKFAIVLTVTSAVCIGTYHMFVRRTFIGEFLNGRKFSA
jgi:glucan biosynthesis protein C